jgi:subtilisin family serine protease
VVLFAAGNGNESVDNDGYASYAKVIAVAACNDQSKRSVYSDFGNAIWCAFPSSDFGYPSFNHPNALTPGIWTTDRLGNFGYNPGNTQFGDAAGKFTNDFGGTSSACPGAAGLAALVLSANQRRAVSATPLAAVGSVAELDLSIYAPLIDSNLQPLISRAAALPGA